MPLRPSRPYDFRLRPAGRAIVLLVTALALAVVICLVWIGVAHPQPDGVPLSGVIQLDGPAAIRRAMAALLLVTCGFIAIAGIVLLAIDIRARGFAGHRLGKHGQQP